VPATNGSISAFPQDPTHLVLDISGYFDSPTVSPIVAMTGNTGTPAQDVPFIDLDPIPYSTVSLEGAIPPVRSAQPNSAIGANVVPSTPLWSGIVVGVKAVADGIRNSVSKVD
jgi:hypothetical protein